MTSCTSYGKISSPILFCFGLVDSMALMKGLGNISSKRAYGRQSAWQQQEQEGWFHLYWCSAATNKSALSADVWSFWTLYLGCMLLCHHFCKQRYYKHFIELVKLLHICLQFKITTEETYGLQGFHQMGRRLWEVSKFVYSTKIYTDERCITNTHLIIYQHAQ